MTLKSRFDLVIFDWAGTMVDFGCEAPVNALIGGRCVAEEIRTRPREERRGTPDDAPGSSDAPARGGSLGADPRGSRGLPTVARGWIEDCFLDRLYARHDGAGIGAGGCAGLCA